MVDQMNSARQHLAHMRAVHADAVRRAEEFGKFVEMYAQALDGESASNPPEKVAAYMHCVGYVAQAEEKIEEIAHVHSGGSDAMRIRQVRSDLRALLTGEVAW